MFRFISALCLLSSSAFAAPTTYRLSEIRALVSSQNGQPLFESVDVVGNSDLKMPAAASQIEPARFLIQYSPIIFESLTFAGREFILFHELGHIRLGHVAHAYPGAEAAKELELEADAFATLLFVQRHSEKIDELRDFLTFMRARDWTVPSGPERADLCDSLL